jgi:tetratricopeptide (TPR) repeat protein
LSEIGEAFLESGYSEDATKAFQSSLHITPENIHIYNRLGIALRKQRKYKEAVVEYKKALAIDPENEYIMFNIGRAYQEWGRTKDAIKYYKKALELYESFPEAIAALKALGEKV